MNTKKNTTAKAEEKTSKETEEMVRVAFHLSRTEIKQLCHLRHEPKPGTAAAQVVRIALDGTGTAGASHRTPKGEAKTKAETTGVSPRTPENA